MDLQLSLFGGNDTSTAHVRANEYRMVTSNRRYVTTLLTYVKRNNMTRKLPRFHDTYVRRGGNFRRFSHDACTNISYLNHYQVWGLRKTVEVLETADACGARRTVTK